MSVSVPVRIAREGIVEIDDLAMGEEEEKRRGREDEI